jgi:ABC-type uncharacterized transport system ATPase subunit
MIDQGIKVLDGSLVSIQEQFNPRVVQVEPIDLSVRFDSIVGVAHTSIIEKTKKVNLRIHDDANPIDVLQNVVAFTPVLSAQIAKPSLDEIFIEQVARNRGTEAADAIRVELDHA